MSPTIIGSGYKKCLKKSTILSTVLASSAEEGTKLKLNENSLMLTLLNRVLWFGAIVTPAATLPAAATPEPASLLVTPAAWMAANLAASGFPDPLSISVRDEATSFTIAAVPDR